MRQNPRGLAAQHGRGHAAAAVRGNDDGVAALLFGGGEQAAPGLGVFFHHGVATQPGRIDALAHVLQRHIGLFAHFVLPLVHADGHDFDRSDVGIQIDDRADGDFGAEFFR